MFEVENNKLIELLNVLENSAKKFPIECPFCHEHSTHIYIHEFDKGHSTAWIWCSSCNKYSCSDLKTPKNFKKASFINEELLCGDPRPLNNYIKEIDNWANSLENIKFYNYTDPSLTIHPYLGTSFIKLKMKYSDIEKIISNSNLKCNISQEIMNDKMINIMDVIDYMTLYFVDNELFQIKFYDLYSGILENNIKLNMPISEALKMDNTLVFDDDLKVYVSKKGYILELDNDLIKSIIIYKKEIIY